MKTVEDRLIHIEAMLEILLKKDFQPNAEEEVGIEEAGKICNLTTKTMYTYVNRGVLNIPYVKKGKSIFFKRTDLLQWNGDRSYKVVNHYLREMKTNQ